MKKSLAITIIMCLIIGIMGGVVNAASASVSASLKSVEIGSNVKVTVSFGEKVSAAQFTLNFDTSKLEYVSKSSGGLFSAATKKFGYNSEDGVTANLGSVTFTFKTKSTGTANVSVSGLKISTATQTGIAPSIGASSVSINIKEKEQQKPTPTPDPIPDQKPNNGGSNTGSNTGSNSNTNTNKTPTAPSKDDNKNTVKEEEKKEENNIVPEEQVPEEKKEENVIAQAPNELIKIDDESAKKLENKETKVMIKSHPVAITDGISLQVNMINENNEKYEQVSNTLSKIKGDKIYFDIKLVKDNNSVQPNGYVTVYIPIPEGYNKDRVEVYYINENGDYELQKGEVQGDYYAFTTNHFSTYALVEKPTIGDILAEIFTNLTVLYSIIGILTIVVIGETVVIIVLKKNKKPTKKSK